MRLLDVVPWGRDLKEYKAMFALDEQDLRSSILGCADGPSSFNVELTRQGGDVVSIDPIYEFTTDAISSRIDETAAIVMEQVSIHQDGFVWNSIRNIDELRKRRLAAMEAFIADFDNGKKSKRYITASLPDLPFKRGAFDLVLCSHLLFLYSEQLDLAFHIDSIKAMCQVGNEVRVFPLLDLKGERSVHVEAVIDALKDAGYTCKIEPVGYEFQKGGNMMLRIQRPLSKG